MDKTDISILILAATCLVQTGWLIWLSQRCLRLERWRAQEMEALTEVMDDMRDLGVTPTPIVTGTQAILTSPRKRFTDIPLMNWPEGF